MMHGARYAFHTIFDLPLPIGLIHAYMTSLEIAANRIVTNLSAQFLIAHNREPGPAMQTLVSFVALGKRVINPAILQTAIPSYLR